jgi:hypothetical protein
MSVDTNSSYTCGTGREAGTLEEIYACYQVFPAQTTLTISSTFFGSSTVVGSIVTTSELNSDTAVITAVFQPKITTTVLV